MIHVHYDYGLVISSVVVALLTCYFAISIEQFLFKALPRHLEKVVLILCGLVLGAAIWCMHFVGMLACHLPGKYSFDPFLTGISYIIAFMTSTFAIWLNTRLSLSQVRLVLGSILMGLGISGMHYVGMMGLEVQYHHAVYNPMLVLLSIVIAITGSGLAFWLTFKYKQKPSKSYLKILIAILMALGIVGMHYTGMFAVTFKPNYSLNEMLSSTQDIVLFASIFVTSLILVAAFCVAILDQRLEERSKQLLKLNMQLASQSLHDILTKLPNRLYLNEYAPTLFNKKQKFAFIYIDLDKFKSINDAFGHELADQLLVQVAVRLHRTLQPSQKLLHMGADEFLLILEKPDIEQAQQVAEEILATLQPSFLISWKEINISASIGISMYPEHGSNLHDLFMNADTAMLQAKFQGRNTYSIFSYDFNQERIKAQSHLMNDLYKAVEANQFVLHYQPKFTAQDFKPCGVEALIRWQHPTQGLLMPSMFIEAAEQNGVIIQMGYWALAKACNQIQIWEQEGRNLFPIAVNLSTVQFSHKHLFSTLEKLFAQYPIKPEHLMIEVTESTAMYQIEQTLKSFKHLRDMGIQLAIDDFGTGYSSFLYLKDLPVNEVKIDRGFILDLIENEKSEFILESIIQLTLKLGLTVTAEGVETIAQAETLARLGCLQLQGYLFSKPKPLEQLEQMDFAAIVKPIA